MRLLIWCHTCWRESTTSLGGSLRHRSSIRSFECSSERRRHLLTPFHSFPIKRQQKYPAWQPGSSDSHLLAHCCYSIVHSRPNRIHCLRARSYLLNNGSSNSGLPDHHRYRLFGRRTFHKHRLCRDRPNIHRRHLVSWPIHNLSNFCAHERVWIRFFFGYWNICSRYNQSVS